MQMCEIATPKEALCRKNGVTAAQLAPALAAPGRHEVFDTIPDNCPYSQNRAVDLIL
jgi:hypothetical protein